MIAIPAAASASLFLSLNAGANATICASAPLSAVPAFVSGGGQVVVSVGAFVGLTTITVTITDSTAVPSCNSPFNTSISVFVDPPSTTLVTLAQGSCGSDLQAPSYLGPQNPVFVPEVMLTTTSTGCAAGYTLVGVHCRWPCLTLAPSNGVPGTCVESTTDTLCSIACNSGYFVVGAVRQCGLAGWTGAEQTCKDLNANHCPALAAPANGLNGTCVDSPLNTQCSFTCNSGYYVVGAPRTCNASTAWSGQAQTCALIPTGSLVYGADTNNDEGYFQVGTVFSVTPRTFESWIKVDPAYSTARNGVVWGTYPAASSINVEMFTNRTARLYWNGGGVSWVPTWVAELDTWTHIAFVVGTASQASLYVNGALHSSVATTFAMVVPSVAFRYGNDYRSAGLQYHGRLDEGRIWSVPRSAQQISTSFAHHLPPGTPGLLVYYKFSTADGTDSSGNAFHGTRLVGANGKPGFGLDNAALLSN